ncbi:hypothetical protein [Nocardioides dongxiaopingii]|uniref:hypothetical protein n=1 Tax=Nocardioides dongxiaopingii TaxID=2576036 RepID=UPI0010C765E9|nr:hypothetical protein [Nocardioides dongxiaopingii]
MDHQRDLDDARSALVTVDHGRRRVIDEIDVPLWYWAGLAVGWVALGVLADTGRPVATAVATFAFATAHAAVAPGIITGRRGSRRLRVSAETVPAHLPVLIVAALVLLTGATVAGSLVLESDGAQHPVTVASVAVALVIVLGGPRLVAAVRRHAGRGPALA